MVAPTAAHTVTLSIDGREVTASAGETVLEAALAAGIDVPRLCFDPRLKPVGACRLCLVEVEGRPGLATACTTAVAEGQVVRTESEELSSLRKAVLEVGLAPAVENYLVALVMATRRPAAYDAELGRWLAYGASPRASQCLILGGKARAVLSGRYHVDFEDVQAVAVAVLRHRLVLNFEAEADGRGTRDVIRELLEESNGWT